MHIGFNDGTVYVVLDLERIDRDYITLKYLCVSIPGSTFRTESELRIPLVNFEGTSTFSLPASPKYTDAGTCSQCGCRHESDEAPAACHGDPTDINVHVKLAEDLRSITFTASLEVSGATRSLACTYTVQQKHIQALCFVKKLE